ncbi:hypothetical protein C7476_11770 [Phyllobacterium bourgognense]|uniref:Uncharacterized protein n=1 Tax=Phyllobacterium bourgognense TaxID=314236 RepID=A0A368YHA7_9HYPH|nr:hypothetical protein C7476_11770 [Phyllobacterium bourgognense]
MRTTLPPRAGNPERSFKVDMWGNPGFRMLLKCLMHAGNYSCLWPLAIIISGQRALGQHSIRSLQFIQTAHNIRILPCNHS